MAVESKILLLDEPFGALDKNFFLDMQIKVKRIRRELGVAAIMVAQDQKEEPSMADRIAVLKAGELEPFSPPAELYDHRQTLLANQFVGATTMTPDRRAGRGRSRDRDPA